MNTQTAVTLKHVKKGCQAFCQTRHRLLLYFTDSKVSKAEAMKKTPVVKKNKRTPGIVYYIFPVIMCKMRPI